MKILVTLPHFYRPTDLGLYGSLSRDRERRLRSLHACLTSLHQTVGCGQGLGFAPTMTLRPTNGSEEVELDVVVCTTRGDHVMDQLPPGLCRHHNTEARGPLLGYECHAVLRDNLGAYDWYVYMEDDLCITDTAFFAKLAWFNALAGDETCVLQPNRYEIGERPPVFRFYIDGTPIQENLRVPPKPQAPLRLEADYLGRPLAFQQVANPHSGTFFLTAAQMRRWAAQPDFLDRSTAYVGALESAATLGLIRHFVVYKPARENAGFLEIRHEDPRYVNRRVAFDGPPPYRIRALQP